MKTMNISPIPEKSRILYLDILRGFAILFIFLANISILSGGYFLPEEQKTAFSTYKLDYVLDMILYIFLDGKFYSIFSILFGIGFVIQYEKMKASGRKFLPFISRRMLALVFLGSIHLFFFWLGDILTLYALLGLVLIAFRDTADKRLLIMTAILLIMPVINLLFMEFSGWLYPMFFRVAYFNYLTSNGFTQLDLAGGQFFIFFLEEYLALTDIQTWLSINVANPLIRLSNLLFEGRFFKVFALFLLGLWAGRQILKHNLLENKKFLFKLLLWGLLIGIPMNVLRALIEFGYWTGGETDILWHIFYAFGVVPLAIAYCALLALGMLKHQHWFMWIAPVGKTAMSNYIFQTLISIGIFYGIGLGYAGQIGFAGQVFIASLIFVWQVLFSTFWLRFFRFGPLEWIWRMLTYGKWIDLRIQRPKVLLEVQS